ncbi:acyl-CoA thioesterase [Apibacter sp. wkB309]|uniref:acyl-CoA thioesterase n=1 Tax=Apibacter sp. wkB309 TaxID=1679467 RepID=UPI000CF980C6|nr:acyl-CoA thioesterase [Apibacter sp. wkB309]PQL92735.1 acyl-CoA thioesterase [Apibacter sp. wkB309]
MKAKTPSDSRTIMTTIVLTNETNAYNNMFGGDLLSLMDRACAIAAQRHAEAKVVTASVNHVSFSTPIPLGSTVEAIAKVSRAFGSSMEVFVDIWVDDAINHTKTKSNEGIYTFVALDEFMKPKKIPDLVPETEEEIVRYNSALHRRELSLLLSGRITPSEAVELRKMFTLDN